MMASTAIQDKTPKISKILNILLNYFGSSTQEMGF